MFLYHPDNADLSDCYLSDCYLSGCYLSDCYLSDSSVIFLLIIMFLFSLYFKHSRENCTVVADTWVLCRSAVLSVVSCHQLLTLPILGSTSSNYIPSMRETEVVSDFRAQSSGVAAPQAVAPLMMSVLVLGSGRETRISAEIFL